MRTLVSQTWARESGVVPSMVAMWQVVPRLGYRARLPAPTWHELAGWPVLPLLAQSCHLLCFQGLGGC